MCGIIGYTGQRDAVEVILDGLRRLEYRGYDSAGIALFNEDGKIELKRRKGKIATLAELFEDHKNTSTTAIGHTRWATHGPPSVENAHPHRSGGIALVHNGIIENYLELKRELQGGGYTFTSDTDTEIIAHLIDRHLKAGLDFEHAVRASMGHVNGAYALAVINEAEPGKIIGVRKDSPLVVGIGEGEAFLASDVPAFLSHCRDVVFMEDGEMAVLTPSGVRFTDFDGNDLEKETTNITWSPSMAEKGGYKHFMLKEIFEQPRAVAETISGRVNPETGGVNLEELGLERDFLAGVRQIKIVACGTSWHAAMAGRYMIEGMARLPVEVDIASEFRYRDPIIEDGSLFIAITQSGETADTLAALREARKRGARIMTICNVIGSTASREAEAVFYTRSGPEIGVASTKAFTTQLVALYLLAMALAEARGKLSPEELRSMTGDLLALPDKIESILMESERAEETARHYFKKRDFLYLGRGINFPIALEGALKLKEISYIHAEAYAAGEMKHGPIALIDEEMPVVFLAGRDELHHKLLSNIQEVKSRGGEVIAVATEGDSDIRELSNRLLTVPGSNRYLTALLLTIPLQLLAYHIGVLRGCDVDQPRNLAKSVTVE